jgi:hypothetical protein
MLQSDFYNFEIIKKMTTKFPLFDSLNNMVSSENEVLTHQVQIDISQKIKKFEKNTQELVYALIKAYQITNPDTTQNTIPFEGKKLKSGLKFDMTKFPCKLQNILSKFVELHENRTDV